MIGRYGLNQKFDVKLTCTVETCLGPGMRMLKGMEVVFLCGIHSRDRNRILKYCVANDISAYAIPRIGDVLMSGAKRMHMFHLPMLRVGRCHPSPEYALVKRLFDIVGSALALIVLAIPMGIVALVIYLDDKGSPIFSQARLTKDGKVFYMHKFRSMCVDAEQKFAEVQKENETDGLAFKSENDPRITRIGHFIRRTSIDELPQLWDVFCGHMSIIGPRPPLPREVVLYTPHQMQRLQVKGGLSCICQVEGRSDMGFEKWVESDLEYIQTRSAGLDLKLVFKTIGVVIMKKGAR